MVFFSRMRIIGVGQVLEDIEMYNRVHEIFSIFSAEGSSYNGYAKGFGNIWEGFADNNAQTNAGNAHVVSDTYLKNGYQELHTKAFK